MAAIHTLSQSIWLIRRRREAPKAARTASSRARVEARAQSKVATFPQAMSKMQKPNTSMPQSVQTS